MTHTHARSGVGLAGQAGLVGKAVVFWLLILAVLGVGVADAVSVARTTLHLSEVAVEAASEGAATFRSEGRSITKACEAVVASLEAQDPSLKLGRNTCVVDAETGRVTVTVRAVADTIVVARLEPIAEYADVVVREVNGGSSV
jgi:hypothetical protein